MRIALISVLAAVVLTTGCSLAQRHDAPAPCDADAPGKRAAWAEKRTELLAEWKTILGPMPKRIDLKTQVVSTEQLPDHTRILMQYQVDAATRGEAYLLLPRGPEKPQPAMVVLHPTSPEHIRVSVGLAGRESNHQALQLVRRGYVCVVPRSFLWEVKGETWQRAAERVLKKGPYRTGMARMVWDAIRTTDLLLERPEVDPNRIGTIGHSLGGKVALYHAAFDDRIAAAISCEGGIGLSFSNWDKDWYLGPQIKAPGFQHDNDEVMSLIAPRALLIIGGESADGAKSQPYMQSVQPLWRLFNAPDRIALLRHQEGHNFPSPGPKRSEAYQWLDQMLKSPHQSERLQNMH